VSQIRGVVALVSMSRWLLLTLLLPACVDEKPRDELTAHIDCACEFDTLLITAYVWPPIRLPPAPTTVEIDLLTQSYTWSVISGPDGGPRRVAVTATADDRIVASGQATDIHYEPYEEGRNIAEITIQLTPMITP
jgi:hypothetical protein